MIRALSDRFRTISIIIGLILILVVFFGHLWLDGAVYYSGDIARIYLPQRHALARSLDDGQLPWWSTDIGIGYPLLAEGETGALYPPNLILYRVLSPEIALNISIVLHFMLAGLGAAWFARLLGISSAGAWISGLVYALGGFNIAHLGHISILSVSAWLPWLLAFTHRLIHARKRQTTWSAALALGLIVCLQFLAGHAQISLLSLMPVGAWALYQGLMAPSPREKRGRLALWTIVLAAGTVLAIPQLIPAAQLGILSQRAGGLESGFFTSYSFHPLLTATFISPFVLGNPYPEGSIEVMGYLGLLPLGLSMVALWRSHFRERCFFLGLATLGLAMAFGRWNPIYPYLEYVPVLNLFRVPARYLLWTSLGLALLAGIGLDHLISLCPRRTDRFGLWMTVLAFLLSAVPIVTTLVLRDNTSTLIAAWRWIPLFFALAMAAMLLGTRRTAASVLAAAVLLITGADLYSYGAVLNQTFSQTWPLEQVIHQPGVLDLLEQEEGLYRSYTKEEILPALSVQRESLYPNIALTYSQSSTNIYMPLIPRAYETYMADLDAERLNRLNVRYYMIPQLLPVDEASELYDVLNPFAAISYGQWYPIDVSEIVAIEVESYVSHAASLADGEPAAELRVSTTEGNTLTLPIRVGLETAEWAYTRSDVAEQIEHSLPPVATTFPARSGFPPEDHDGHTYLAQWSLEETMALNAIQIMPIMPEAFVRIERIRLIGADGRIYLVPHLLDRGDHTIIYRSEDVLVYENHDVLPRAYTIPLTEIIYSKDEIHLPTGSLQDRISTAEITSHDAHAVVVETTVSENSVLILADLYYPGWKATINDVPAEILPVDTVFRGLLLDPGTHQVHFEYAGPL